MGVPFVRLRRARRECQVFAKSGVVSVRGSHRVGLQVLSINVGFHLEVFRLIVIRGNLLPCFPKEEGIIRRTKYGVFRFHVIDSRACRSRILLVYHVILVHPQGVVGSVPGTSPRGGA